MRKILLLSLFVILATATANAAPVIRLTVNGSTDNANLTTEQLANVRFGLVANELAGKELLITLKKISESDEPDNVATFIPKAADNWSSKAGRWLEGIFSFRVPASAALATIPMTLVRSKVLSEGTTIFVATVKDVASGNVFTKAVMAYAHRDSHTKFLSSERMNDGRFKYVLGLDSSAIAGDKSSPTAAGPFSDWVDVPLQDTDGDGFYELTVIAFDGPIIFNWAGNKAQNSWANSWKGGYRDLSTGNDRVDLYRGMMFRPGKISIALPIGDGDDVTRISVNSATGEATICNNLKTVYPYDVSSPIVMGPFNNWIPQPFNSISSSGWACFTVTGTQPYRIEWVSSGKYPVSWVSNKTIFYKTDRNCALIENGTAATCP